MTLMTNKQILGKYEANNPINTIIIYELISFQQHFIVEKRFRKVVINFFLRSL